MTPLFSIMPKLRIPASTVTTQFVPGTPFEINEVFVRVPWFSNTPTLRIVPSFSNSLLFSWSAPGRKQTLSGWSRCEL